MPMTPTTFLEENMSEWGSWVLGHGLPAIPTTLELGHAVPVARWVGLERAGVLFTMWQWSEVEEIEPSISTEAYLYVRTGTRWHELEGSVGGSYWRGPELDIPDVAPEYVHIGQKVSIYQGCHNCAATIGEVGSRGHHLRVTNGRSPEVGSIESPLNLFIVCFDAALDALVEVCDDENNVLSGYLFTSTP